MKNLCEIFRLPKWAKISLVALSVVAFALLVATFALQSWADNKLESANLTFSKVDKAKSADLENGYAYEVRVHFPRLDFLLRSRTISHIDLEKIAWIGSIDSSAIQSVETHNRRLNFTTTQQLNLDSGANLGTMSYKMDFSPFSKAIIKYYVALMILFTLALIFYNVFKSEVHRFFAFLKAESLPQAIWQGYKNINPLYRHTFWIVFIACNIVFGFHTVQFLWGNHDWHTIIGKNSILFTLVQGRYTQNAISMFLQGEKLLPILNNILAFLGLSLASVWLCMYLNIQRKLWIWVIVGLILTLQPFTLTRMYFAFQVAGLFIAVAIGMLGFVLAKKAGEYSTAAQIGGGNALYSKRSLKPYILCFLSILCIHWGIASYQPFIDTALILLCGGIIAIIIDNKGNLKTSLYKSRFLIISVVLAGISYKITLDILKKLGTVGEFYNNKLVHFNEMPEHIVLAIKLGFGNLFKYDVAFMPLSMTILFAIFLVIFFVLLVCSKLKFKAKFFIFILLCGAIFGSQMHNVLAETIIDNPIVDYYGLMFVRILFVILAFKVCIVFTYNSKLVQNLYFVISIILIYICVMQDLYFQKVQKLAFDSEIRVFNRVLSRIEQNENFSYEKQYCGIMFGEFPNFGKKYLHNVIGNKYNTAQTLSIFNSRVIESWNVILIFNMFMPHNIFSKCNFFSSNYQYHKLSYTNKDKSTMLNIIYRLDKAGILEKLQPYPHKDSVVVFEDIIVIVADKVSLDEIRQTIKDIHGMD